LWLNCQSLIEAILLIKFVVRDKRKVKYQVGRKDLWELGDGKDTNERSGLGPQPFDVMKRMWFLVVLPLAEQVT